MRFFFACLLTTLFVSCARPPDSAVSAVSAVSVKLMRSLKEQNSYEIRGFVLKPGRYLAQDHPTLTEAIDRAGGFSPLADDHRVYLRRGSELSAQRIIINVDKITRRKDPHELNPVLKAGDVIVVDEKKITF